MSEDGGAPRDSPTTGVLAFLTVFGLTTGILSAADYTGLKAIVVGFLLSIAAYQFGAHQGLAAGRRRTRQRLVGFGSLAAAALVLLVAAVSDGGTSDNRAESPTATPAAAASVPTRTPSPSPSPTATPTRTPAPIIEMGTPDSEIWQDVRIALSETDFRGDPLEHQVAEMRVFVSSTRRCLWRYVRVGDALTVHYGTRRYAFDVLSVDGYYGVDLRATRTRVGRRSPLRCQRA